MAYERGEARHCAKLTEDKVREIRALYEVRGDNGRRLETCHTLAPRFGVTHVAIHHIISRKSWKHVL